MIGKYVQIVTIQFTKKQKTNNNQKKGIEKMKTYSIFYQYDSYPFYKSHEGTTTNLNKWLIKHNLNRMCTGELKEKHIVECWETLGVGVDEEHYKYLMSKGYTEKQICDWCEDGEARCETEDDFEIYEAEIEGVKNESI
jgi:hypothetical protein